MFRHIRNTILFLYGEPLLPAAEKPAKKDWSNVCTPDQLIAARIIESIAREFDDWKVSGSQNPQYWRVGNGHHSGNYQPAKSDAEAALLAKSCECYTLYNKKRKLTVKFLRESDRKYNHDWGFWYCRSKPNGECAVNMVDIDAQCGKKIAEAYDAKKKAVDAALAEAAAALARQKLNEQKWNLAEHAFGIKRDGLGRIIFDQYPDKVKPVKGAE